MYNFKKVTKEEKVFILVSSFFIWSNRIILLKTIWRLYEKR